MQLSRLARVPVKCFDVSQGLNEGSIGGRFSLCLFELGLPTLHGHHLDLVCRVLCVPIVPTLGGIVNVAINADAATKAIAFLIAILSAQSQLIRRSRRPQ